MRFATRSLCSPPAILAAVLTAVLVPAGGAAPALAANHNVQVQNFSFSPTNLTIQAGDTVTWTNTGGIHNVEASDGSFRCANGCDGEGGNGNPSSSAWSFTRTFTTPGLIPYICGFHGPSMAGSITVEQVDPDEPGQLRFAAAAQSRSEGAGQFDLTVDRIGGDDGAVSVDFATSDGSADQGADYTPAAGTLFWADGDDAAKTFSVPILEDSADEPNETVNVALSSPTGGAGLAAPSSATLTITDNDAPAPSAGTIGFASPSFQGGEGSDVTVQVLRQGGDDGAVSVDFTTGPGSANAGADYTPASGTLTWGNNQDGVRTFVVPLVDDGDEEASETVHLTLNSPTGGAVLGTSMATLTILDNDAPTGCKADDFTFCLNEERFRVRVDFTDPATGAPRQGRAFDFGNADSGLFFFFSDDNIEMLIKVLDACELPGFNNYWVFYAATTNVEFRVTVTDTQSTLPPKVYTNPAGTAAPPVLDTSAFDTCP